MMPDPPSQDPQSIPNVAIELFCIIPDDNLRAFEELLRWIFGSLIAIPELLSMICIVPKGEISKYVNILISCFAPGARPYQSGVYTPEGVAIPIETDDGATACVLIDESQILKLSTANFLVPDVISTIIEEILHVQLYSLAWRRRGFIQYKTERFGCKTEFFVYCSQFHDEYAVCRLKTQMLRDNLYFLNEQGQPEPVAFAYGAPLDESINKTIASLKQLVIGVTSGSISIVNVWRDVLNQVYRGILEPLARNAAFVVSAPDGEHPNNNANNSPFYSTVFAPYWRSIESELSRSFENDFTEEESTIDSLVEQLDEFLKTIGVSIRTLENGDCWADFSTSFFDRMDF